MTIAQDVVCRYADGERNFIGANLSGADLSGAYLIGANLRGAYLIGAYLRGAYLRGADLIGANLIGADLSGADLRGANLSEANLRGAYLREANLSEANLRLTGVWQAFAPSPHGWAYLALEVTDPAVGWVILAGCRRLTLADARAHWSGDRSDGEDGAAIEAWVQARLDLLDPPSPQT